MTNPTNPPQFTPGPWRCEAKVFGYDIIGGSYVASVTRHDTALTMYHEQNKALRLEAEANARLIASAPALYAALEAIVAHADKRQAVATAEMQDPELHRLPEPAFVEQARAALAAANGSGVGK